MIDQGEFASVERIRRKFVAQLFEQRARLIGLVFALVGERQKDFRERREVTPLIRGELHLLHAFHAVAVNSIKPQEGLFERGHAADHVIGRAKATYASCAVGSTSSNFAASALACFIRLKPAIGFFTISAS